MDPQKNNKKAVKSSVSLLRYTDIVFRMGMTIALGMWLGKMVDEKMGRTSPLFMPILSIVGVGVAMFMVIRDANKLKG
jgi:F0F1-type ATP synthase assembly protein I